MTMTRPSPEQQRVDAVQRAARYVLSRDALGHARFGAMDIFPPELGAVVPGSPEHAWRQQLSWAWARAGFLDENIAGKNLDKRRIYTLLPAGRVALERVAEDPQSAAFYAKNHRASGGAAPERPQTFFRPPELVQTLGHPPERSAVSTPANLRSASAVDAAPPNEPSERSRALRLVEPLPAPEVEDEGEAGAPPPLSGSNLISTILAEIQGLGTYFEGVTGVLERLDQRITKVEGVAKSQTALLLEATKLLGSGGGGTGAGVTREQLAEALAEVTAAFIKDDPKSLQLASSLKKHEELLVQLSGEIGSAMDKKAAVDGPWLAAEISRVLKEDVNAGIAAGVVTAALQKSSGLRAAISEEVTRVLHGNVTKDLIRKIVSDEIRPGLNPVIEAVVRTEDKLVAHVSAASKSYHEDISKDVQQRLGSRLGSIAEGVGRSMEALESKMDGIAQGVERRFAEITSSVGSSVDARLENIAPDVNALRGLSEKLSGEITSSFEKLKANLEEALDEAQDLGERIDNAHESLDAGHAEFQRQGRAVALNFTQTAEAARAVLDAADSVAKEMMMVARIRAMQDGATYEETRRAGNALVERTAAAADDIKSKVGVLGGGLIMNLDPDSGAPIVPIILPPADEEP